MAIFVGAKGFLMRRSAAATFLSSSSLGKRMISIYEEVDDKDKDSEKAYIKQKGKAGLSVDFITLLQRKFDLRPVAIRAWFMKKKFEKMVKFQSQIRERRALYGLEIGGASFILDINGSVRFEGQKNWIKVSRHEKHRLLPTLPVRGTCLEAVDASNTNILYEGLDNLSERIPYPLPLSIL